MNWIELAWAMMAAASLTLGLIHLLVWCRGRSRYAHLAFFVLATSVAVFSGFELTVMRAQSPAEYATVARWAHVPLAIVIVSIIGFVHFHFDSGRLWLAYAAVGFRLLALALNFLTGVNLNYLEVSALGHTTLWGGAVAAFPIGIPNPWQIVALIGNLLLVAFVVDASITLWRRGEPVARRRAALVGGSLVLCIVVVGSFAAMIVTGTAKAPTILTPGFLVVVLAMGYELSWEVIVAAQLAAKLQTSEVSLRASEERFRAVVESVPSAILLVDGDGRVTLSNAQAHALFGYRGDELVGLMVDQLVPARLRSSHEGYREGYALDAQARAMASTREVYALNKDQIEVPVEVVLRPIWTAGAMYVLVSLVDLTERRQMERSAVRQRDQIAHLSRVAMLAELSGSLAHELNQPLTAILSNAQTAQYHLAQNPVPLEKVSRIVGEIVKNDRRAGAVIQRLRSLLKKEEAQYQALNVNDVIRDALRLMHSDLVSRQVTMNLDLADALPKVDGDRVQLQQVLLNLVINAREAMDDWKGHRRIVVRTRLTERGGVEISVADDGDGVPPQDLERIFEAFVTTKAHGMGLGLAICRSIVEAHGGRLVATNNAGRGATFQFELPVRAG